MVSQTKNIWGPRWPHLKINDDPHIRHTWRGHRRGVAREVGRAGPASGPNPSIGHQRGRLASPSGPPVKLSRAPQHIHEHLHDVVVAGVAVE
eukprot:3838938-Pyramimonas_sp.AAC.1